MMSAPEKEHDWLQRFVGEWAYEHECAAEPGKEPMKSHGTERVRPVGRLWVACEGQGEMPGGGVAVMILTLGYDTPRKKFVGTWIGSMMTTLWAYEGTLDPAGRVLTLETEGPNVMGDGKVARFREVIEWSDDDNRTFTSFVQGEDGGWKQVMKARYKRMK